MARYAIQSENYSSDHFLKNVTFPHKSLEKENHIAGGISLSNSLTCLSPISWYLVFWTSPQHVAYIFFFFEHVAQHALSSAEHVA